MKPTPLDTALRRIRSAKVEQGIPLGVQPDARACAHVSNLSRHQMTSKKRTASTLPTHHQHESWESRRRYFQAHSSEVSGSFERPRMLVRAI
ncbi:hypothetical protein VTO73DRAFT_1092 [Trametes versicolor]